MRIRLCGTPAQVNGITADLRRVLDVQEESEDYPNRPPSKLIRRYLDVDRADGQHRAIGDILAEVAAERQRQLDKWGVQHRQDDTGGRPMDEFCEQAREACQAADRHRPGGASWRHVLTEEFAEALAETEPARLRAELVQVAAVCAAWIEDLDHRTAPARAGAR